MANAATYLKNFEASVKSGAYDNPQPLSAEDFGSLPPIEDLLTPQPMEALPPMPMEQEQPVQVQASPMIETQQVQQHPGGFIDERSRLGANVNASAPVGPGNLNVNAALIPGNNRANVNYAQPLGPGNLDMNASVARGGVNNVGVGYGQPVGNAYLRGDVQYQPQSRNVDVGVNYQGQSGGIGLRYQPRGNAVMLNATKRF